MQNKHLFILLVLLLAISTFSANQIHFGSSNNPLNGLAVTWSTSAETSKIKWGYTNTYEQGEFDCSSRTHYVGYLYDYNFPILNPSSTIYYSIFDGSWTAENTFKTAVDTNSNKFKFIAGGDSRTYVDDWKLVADVLDTVDADFTLYLGDIVNSGTVSNDWDMWFSKGEEYIKNSLIYHSYGNHDISFNYKNLFKAQTQSSSGDSIYYTFTYGNARIICLNSADASNATQLTWLTNVLENNTKAWTIIFFHMPFFTAPSHVNDMTAHRNTWWKLFDDHGVDVVFNGHTHNYQRTKPINLNISSSAAVNNYGSGINDGRLQVVAGQFGAPSSGVATGWFIEKSISKLHYTTVEIDNDTLKFKAIYLDGTVFDSVTLSKTPPGADSIAPVLSNLLPTESTYRTNITLSAKTDEAAELRWSLIDESYDNMANQFSVGENTSIHSTSYTATHGLNTIYVRAIDDSNNVTNTSSIISFTVDTNCISAEWFETKYDHSLWSNAPAVLGYGESYTNTVISYGNDASNKYPTAYFRHSFSVADASTISNLNLGIKYDDGIKVFLNGVEVANDGIPVDADFNTPSTVYHEGSLFESLDISASINLINTGINVIAVEVHQISASSSDFTFDLELKDGSTDLISLGANWYYWDKDHTPEEISTCSSATVFSYSNINKTAKLLTLPNPFNPTVTVSLSNIKPFSNIATLSVYSTNGALIKKSTLNYKNLKNGYTINGSNWASGLYIVKLELGKEIYTNQIILMK